MVNLTCQFSVIPFEPPAYRYSIASFFSIGAVISGSINVTVLLSIWKTPSLHKPSYILVAAIALADFFAGFFGGIMLAVSHVFVSTIARNSSSSWLDFNCKLIIACKAYGYIVCGASILTLTGMSIDRLMAITMKTRYNNNFTILKKMGFCLSICWFAIIFLSSYFAIDVTPQKLKTVFLISGITAAIMISIIVICYSVAYYKLKKLSSPGVAPNNPGNRNLNLQKYRKTLNTFVLVCVFLLVCYTPFIFACMVIFSNGLEIPTDQFFHNVKFLDISELWMYCSAMVNPMLYVWRMKELQNAIMTVVKRVPCFSRNQTVDVNN